MKMKLMVSFAILLIVFSIVVCKKGTTTSVDMANLKDFSGVLMDVTSGTSGVSPDNKDIKKTPQDQTVANLKAGESSGYGIMILDSNLGIYKFTKFDAKGNELAIQLLKNTTKEKGIEIDIKGSRGEDDIKVASIVEK